MSIFSVSEANRYIKQIFDKNAVLASILVCGELSNFKRHYSGHCYFTIKDSQSAMKAVMFKSRAQFLKFEPRDGLKVIAGGNITVFERDGQYQLYVEQLLPEGFGELSLAFNQLKEKLGAQGLFDETHKKPLPLLPNAVGIATSPTGAALRDIITVSKRRHPGITLHFYPVQVQGVEAPAQIVQAIKVFNKLGQVDVIIVGRGGGSIEELWAFNDEKVVHAIAESVIPVVSAVGHQTDYTLADFAADRRAATPSQAAEIVVPDVKELSRYIITRKIMLENNMLNRLKTHRASVERVMNRRIFKYPRDFLRDKQQRVDYHMQKLEQGFKHLFITKQHHFKIATEKLAMLNPLAVLARGYSIVRTLDGRVIRKPSDTDNGQVLEVVLQYGVIKATVLHSREEHSDET